jgi:hypothetical protein
LQSRRGRSPGLITAAGDPTGRPTRPALFARPACHRMMVPANASLNQRASRPRELGPNSQRAINRRRGAGWQALFPSVIFR